MGSLNQAKESMREKKDLLKKHDGNLLKKKEQKSYCGSDQNKKDNDGSFLDGKSKSGDSQKELFSEALQRKHQQRVRVARYQVLLTRVSNY